MAKERYFWLLAVWLLAISFWLLAISYWQEIQRQKALARKSFIRNSKKR